MMQYHNIHLFNNIGICLDKWAWLFKFHVYNYKQNVLRKNSEYLLNVLVFSINRLSTVYVWL